jgi:outer membrane protein OmpA-like peptidoglycan-associated protein
LTGLITPDVVGKAASTLGESDSSIRRGIGAAFPALLSGVATRSDDAGFASSLFDLVRSPANDGGVLNDVDSLFSAGSTSPMMNLGGKLLTSLFGGGASGITNALAGYAGMKNSSASTLLSVAAPLVLAILGKRVRKDNLSPTGLAALLRSQKDSFAAAVPAALANAGGFHAAPAKERDVYAVPPAASRSPAWRWLVPALVAIAAIALLVPLFSRKDDTEGRTATTAAVAPVVPAATATVYFDVEQTVPLAESVRSLSTVIEYMKDNPGATAVVSGYHDPSGNQAANEELAKDRANSVRATLIEAGIEDSRIEMQKPVVTEGGGDPEEARRVEVTAG